MLETILSNSLDCVASATTIVVGSISAIVPCFSSPAAIAKEGNTAIEEHSNETFYIPECMDEVSPLLSVIPLQIYAYYVAKEKGCEIDRPRNLAKSVTVE